MGLIGLLLLSCGGKTTQKVVLNPVKTPLIHPLFFQDEIAAQLNFPFWFNDSIMREQHIQTITWTVYGTTQMDDENEKQGDDYPKTKTIYTFNENGRLVGLQRSDYSEGLTISSGKYAIIPTAQPVYSQVKRVQPLHLGTDESVESYSFLRPVNANPRILQYDDDYADVRYHFFPLKKCWGALSIDSIGHPGSSDWVILGTPVKPEKRYQVVNTVTERNVTHYEYLHANYPKMITWSDYPFTQKRTFTYSKSGVFTGYIDSTFIDQEFVTRTTSRFGFDGLKRPARIVHEKGHASADHNYETIEKISYSTFPTP
jgi:hypothetical protein